MNVYLDTQNNFRHSLLCKIYKYIYIYMYLYIDIVIFICWRPFILSRNLDEVFTYNHIWL